MKISAVTLVMAGGSGPTNPWTGSWPDTLLDRLVIKALDRNLFGRLQISISSKLFHMSGIEQSALYA